jgi:hypothetical protein
MKKPALVFAALLAVTLIALISVLIKNRTPPTDKPSVRYNSLSNSSEIAQAAAAARPTNALAGSGPSLTERAKMSDSQRFAILERLGRLPKDADSKDARLAQKTTWWGKRLDPKTFWKDKVIWRDSFATAEALAHGRMWPPIPYDDPSLSQHPDEDRAYGKDFAAEGTASTSISSSKERAFWTKFMQSHPQPPEDIERVQLDLAERILSVPKTLQQLAEAGRGSAATSNALALANESARHRDIDMGYPAEALSDSAIFWAYVSRKRFEYEELLQAGQTPDTFRAKVLLERLLVETNYVTAPPSSDQQKAANAWKITYLQRLRGDKADESYINAYLQAWNLSTNDVFRE